MDTIYHAVKNLLKSLINLFAAILELFTDLINWLASCLRNFYPHISGKYAQIHESRKRGVGLLEQKWSKKKSSRKKIAAEVIRRQLKEEVTGREQYYEAYFRVSEDGNGFYAIFVSVLGLIYAGCVVIAGRIGGRELMVLALAAMILACGAVCLMIRRRQRKTEENRLAAHILEKEFADMLYEGEAPHKKAETVQDGTAAGQKKAETLENKTEIL